MNLLLLLSALLSACTGVLSAGGQIVARPSVSRGLGAPRADVAIARAAAMRPASRMPQLAVSALFPIAVTLALVAAEPAYATRRRE